MIYISVWSGISVSGMVYQCMEWYIHVRYCMSLYGVVYSNIYWISISVYGLVYPCMVWCISVRYGISVH